MFRKYRQNSRALFERTQKLYLLKHIFFKVCGTQAGSNSNFKQKKRNRSQNVIQFIYTPITIFVRNVCGGHRIDV